MNKKLTTSRRNFLKGLAATAAATVGGAPGLAAAGPTRPLRVGLLLPGSSRYPQLGENLLAGFRLYLEMAGGQRIEWLRQDIGVTPGRALQGARRLLESRQVDLLAGALSSAAVMEIKTSLEETRTPLVVTNFGANTVRFEEESPFVFYNTLNHWQRSFTAGAWAAREFGRKALVVASLLDSGFDHLYAVEAGVKAVGGEVTATLVTDRTPGEHDLVGVLAALEEIKPDFIYLLHSDPVAALLVRQLAERSAGRVPLVAADMVMSDPLLAMQGGAARGITGVTAWSTGLPLAENRSFVVRYRRWTRQEPDSFAVLGYETAQLLEQALTAADGVRGDALLAALGRAEVTSPRGRVQMQPLTHRTVAPNYLQQVQPVNGSLEPVVLREMVTAPGVEGTLASLHAGPRSGWLNDYPFL